MRPALIWQWKDGDPWLREHPDAAVGIVTFLADRSSVEPWMMDAAVAVLERALDAGATHDTVRAAAESLVAQGSQAAATLAERLKS